MTIAAAAVAPTNTRDFLTKVGMVSTLVVGALLLLNLLSPEKPKLTCVNPEVHATGVAARGRGNRISVEVQDPKGAVIYTKLIRSEVFSCAATFGEGWHDR